MTNSMVYNPELPPVYTMPTMGRVKDRDALRRFLTKDRYAHAYLLGYLDPMYEPFAKWYGDYDAQGHLQCVLLHYIGLSIPIVFLVGRSEQLPRFLSFCRDTLPARFHFHVADAQMEAFTAHFPVESSQLMQRMGMTRSQYSPVELDGRVERLGHRDTGAIMKLYAHYPDHFFEPYQMETGLYFGVRNDRDELMSISGIHNVNAYDDIAVVGNLVTHPSVRGQGLAKVCTGALLNELFQRVACIALNVDQGNEPAIRVYQSFGFTANNDYYEGRSQS